jgi:cell division protein FtsB
VIRRQKQKMLDFCLDVLNNEDLMPSSMDPFSLPQPQSPVLSPLWRLVPQVLLGAIFFVVIGIMLSMFRPQMAEQIQLDGEIARLTLEKDYVGMRRDQLKQRMAWMKSDSEYLEIQSRDLLNLSAPGETIIRYQEKPL